MADRDHLPCLRVVQWEFQSCGAGFIIKSVSAGLFLSLEDLQGLHRDGSTEVVAGRFPMCWEMEIMDNGSADNEDDGDGDVYARYVVSLICSACPWASFPH